MKQEKDKDFPRYMLANIQQYEYFINEISDWNRSIKHGSFFDITNVKDRLIVSELQDVEKLLKERLNEYKGEQK